MKTFAALLLLVNIWAAHANCPDVANFENGSMIKYLGKTGAIEEIEFQCVSGKYILGAKRITCQSGSWSHEIPVCQGASRCSNVLPPVNGSIRFTLLNDSIIVEFDCIKGYMIDNLYDEAIRCDLHTGVWSNSAPLCKRITACNPIPAPIDGVVSMEEGTTLEDPFAIVGFGCRLGYHLVGSQRLYCNGTGFWNEPPPTCEKTIRCPNASNPANGGYQSLPSSNMGNKRVQFYCNEGFVLQGVEYNRCINGRWLHPTPTCVYQANCPVPVPDPSVKMSPISATYEERSIVTFYCNNSYHTMHGSNSMYCMKGKWEGLMPVCQERRCPTITPPKYGSVIYSSKGEDFGPNSVATFECNDGLVFFGTKRRICNDWGAWTYSRYTVCEKNVTCPLEFGPNYTVTKASWTRIPLPQVSSMAAIKCDRAFEPTYTQYSTCQPGGRWSYKPKPCKPRKPCPLPIPPKNATLRGTFSTYYSGDFVRITCDAGFSMVGNSVMYCRERRNAMVWQNPPRCMTDEEMTAPDGLRGPPRPLF